MLQDRLEAIILVALIGGIAANDERPERSIKKFIDFLPIEKTQVSSPDRPIWKIHKYKGFELIPVAESELEEHLHSGLEDNEEDLEQPETAGTSSDVRWSEDVDSEAASAAIDNSAPLANSIPSKRSIDGPYIDHPLTAIKNKLALPIAKKKLVLTLAKNKLVVPIADKKKLALTLAKKKLLLPLAKKKLALTLVKKKLVAPLAKKKLALLLAKKKLLLPLVIKKLALPHIKKKVAAVALHKPSKKEVLGLLLLLHLLNHPKKKLHKVFKWGKKPSEDIGVPSVLNHGLPSLPDFPDIGDLSKYVAIPRTKSGLYVKIGLPDEESTPLLNSEPAESSSSTDTGDYPGAEERYQPARPSQSSATKPSETYGPPPPSNTYSAPYHYDPPVTSPYAGPYPAESYGPPTVPPPYPASRPTDSYGAPVPDGRVTDYDYPLPSTSYGTPIETSARIVSPVRNYPKPSSVRISTPYGSTDVSFAASENEEIIREPTVEVSDENQLPVREKSVPGKSTTRK